MLRKIVFVALAMMLISSMWVGAVSAGQPKVTVCHKPGTDAEKTLTISSKALPAHLAHGDTEGECGGAPPSTACVAFNEVVTDPQTDDFSYVFGISTAEFSPGEILHINMTITTDSTNTGTVYQSVGVGGPIGAITSENQDVDPGQTGTVSLDYTVVDGVAASSAAAFAGGGAGSFTLDDVNIWCTPN